MSHPNDKVQVSVAGGGKVDGSETIAEVHLGHLPGQVLLDVARNESAPREWRKAAVELMLDKGYKQAYHNDLQSFLAEIKAEREAKEDVQAVVESAIQGPLD